MKKEIALMLYFDYISRHLNVISYCASSSVFYGKPFVCNWGYELIMNVIYFYVCPLFRPTDGNTEAWLAWLSNLELDLYAFQVGEWT